MIKIINFLKDFKQSEESDFDDYLANIPDEVEKERIKSYGHYHEYFDGDIVKYTDLVEGDRPYSNVIQNFVYKLNGWLLQEPPVIKSRSVVSDLVNELIDELLENSEKSLYQSILLNSSVYGDCFVKIFVDLKEINITKENILTFGFKVLKNPSYVMVSYDSNSNMNMCIVVYPDIVNEFNIIEKDIKYSYPLYFEIWTDKFVYCSYNTLLDEARYLKLFKNKVLINAKLVDDKESPFYNLYMFDNIYGEIPIVHFRNLNFFSMTYGVSDVRNLTVIAREKTSLLNLVKDIIDYQGDPIMVLKGARYNELDKSSSGKIISNLPENAEFSFLSLNIGDLDEIIEKYESMLNEEISGFGIPYDFLVSSEKFIGGDSSASALKLKFSSILVYLVLKKVFLEASFEKLFSIGLRLLNEYNDLGLEKVKFSDFYTARKVINFNENIQEQVFDVFLDSMKDDEVVKQVVDELESMGFQVKSKDVMEILKDLSDEYEKKYSMALDYLENLYFDEKKMDKFIKLRSVPYNKIEFSFKSYLPHTRRQILDDLEVELRNNIESLTGALDRLGVKNPEKKLDEILRDSEILGTIRGVASKSEQMELVDVEKVRNNLQLLNQLEEEAMRDMQNMEGMEEEQEINQSEESNEAFQEELPRTTVQKEKRVLDSIGGKGRKKVKENPQKIEDRTGQSAESIIEKRKEKSQN